MPGKPCTQGALARHRCPSLLKKRYYYNNLYYNRQATRYTCVCFVFMAGGAGADTIKSQRAALPPLGVVHRPTGVVPCRRYFWCARWWLPRASAGGA